MSFFVRCFTSKWIHPPIKTTESHKGRTIIVTGGSSGMGPEAAFKYASLGASKVIISSRDLKKGEATKQSLDERLGNESQIEVWELDMNSFDSVVAFARRANELENLDIAVLNAGVWRVPFVRSKHGWEEELQVNTLSTTLLGMLLLPKLKQSNRHTGNIPVLEFVNSGLHRRANVPAEVREKKTRILEHYNQKENFREGNQYNFSKLFLMYATNCLASAVSSEDVIITSVCPGFVKSGLGRDHFFPGVFVVAWLVFVLFFKTASQGADVIVSGTSKGQQLHGQFWKDDQVQPIAENLTGEENKALGRRVWAEIVGVLKQEVPAVTEVLDEIMP